MEWLWNGLADLRPAAPPTLDAALSRLAQAELRVCLIVLAAALFLVGMHEAMRLRREWIAARLRALEAAHVVSAEVLAVGMKVLVDLPSEAAIRRVSACIQAADRRWLTLEVGGKEGDRPLAIGAPLRVTATGPGAAFRFHATIRDRHREGEALLLTLDRPAWVEKIQRREFYRVPTRMPILVSRRTPSEEVVMHPGLLEDLSAGGVRFLLSTPLEARTPVRLRLPDSALSGWTFDARVVSSVPIPSPYPGICSRRPRYRIQCAFLYLSEETRSMLVRACFDMERELRRSGESSR